LTGGQERRTGLTVAEAADVLGISKDAVRKRIARGTLQAAKQDGEWMVFLDDGDQYKTSSQDAEDTSHFWELINDQKQEIERLRQELEKKDAWITELIQRIPPQLPAPEQQAAATREGWWQRLWRRK
jgi:excisionase family DNA binding protein